MSAIQSRDELEQWHSQPDPWNYKTQPQDAERKRRLLAALPERQYDRVLDIGCGQGFVTHDLPGRDVLGIDLSVNAIRHAREPESARHRFEACSVFDLPGLREDPFDLIVITGLMYPQYIGRANQLLYRIIDDALGSTGILITAHISSWYSGRFPYLLLHRETYAFGERTHVLEVYVKPPKERAAS